MTSYFYLLGKVTLINNGHWIYNSGSELYWDYDATWVNIGWLEVIKSSVDFIKGTTFPGRSVTEVGTMVNMGTIDFKESGGLNFQQKSGTFLQCEHGIMKFSYDDDGTPGTISLPDVKLDGYVGIHYGGKVKPSTTVGQTVFTWVKPAAAVPTGSVSLVSDYSGSLADLSTFIVCFSKTLNTATINYVKVTDPLCPSGYTQILDPIPTGDACSGLPDSIKILKDLASCPASAGCGTDTGKPSGDTPAAANVNVASLAFLISLVCLLLKF